MFRFMFFNVDVTLRELLVLLNRFGQFRVYHWIPRCRNIGSGYRFIHGHLQVWWSEGISSGDGTPR